MCLEARFGAAAVRYVSVRSEPGSGRRTDGHGQGPQAAPSRSLLALTCHFSGCLLAVAEFLVAGFGLGVLGAEDVGDALVDGGGLTVDAVRRSSAGPRRRGRPGGRPRSRGPAGSGAAPRSGRSSCLPRFSCRIDGLHELDIKVDSNAVHECGDLVKEAVLVR
jgi:hypothetical protein